MCVSENLSLQYIFQLKFFQSFLKKIIKTECGEHDKDTIARIYMYLTLTFHVNV